jgi:rhodanese-related sulfurtransferase
VTIKKFIVQTSIILAISCVIGFTFNGFSKSPLPIFTKYNPLRTVVKGENNQDDIQGFIVNEIDAETLKYLLESEEVLLFDARAVEEYREGCLPTAVSFPAYEFDRVYPRVEGLFVTGKTIITYCSSVTCTDSPLLAKKLSGKGHENVFVYRGGFKEWSELNYPVEKPQATIQE